MALLGVNRHPSAGDKWLFPPLSAQSFFGGPEPAM